MPSRWQKRTQEEKDAILLKQRSQEQQAQRRHTPITDRFFDPNKPMELYRNHDIPIFCPHCYEWTGSDKYRVIEGSNPMTGKPANFIEGTCRTCKQRVKRVYPYGNLDEIMVFGMALTTLFQQGRVSR